ncbi:TolC family protein [Bacteroides gallinaceum]|uniref:TolC family protein n=1 Tax=Bacteroides gallinaceum TaxID=1462571 RepID=A0ABT7VC11_9BACE|nr:TolC family protein [Bacteroides gallinaceum]
METGIRNNLSLKNSRLSVLKSKTALTQSRSRLLPVLSADFRMADYLMKPANVTTGTLLGNDFPDDPTWQKIQSMQYAMTAGIQFGMPLYNQTVLSAAKVARTVQEISTLSYEKAVEDLTVQDWQCLLFGASFLGTAKSAGRKYPPDGEALHHC